VPEHLFATGMIASALLFYNLGQKKKMQLSSGHNFYSALGVIETTAVWLVGMRVFLPHGDKGVKQSEPAETVSNKDEETADP